MPPERREELLLVDIVDRADTVAAALARFEGEDLDEDDVVKSAVLWSTAVIGEAANRLPTEFCARHPEIDWRRVIGFRNLVLHAYDRVDPSIVLVIARERVPELRQRVMSILKAEFPLAAKAVEEHETGRGSDRNRG